MKSTANTIVFESTGREVYANHAIVGICPDGQAHSRGERGACGAHDRALEGVCRTSGVLTAEL